MSKNLKTSPELKVETLDSSVLAKIENAVSATSFGSITLTVQDSRLLQMERIEKVRFDDSDKQGISAESGETVRAKVLTALRGLRYGQVSLIIKDGRITQLERTEKQRFAAFQGINGEGI